MSSIKDIIRTEQEAARIVDEATKKAEEIKAAGREKAKAILEEAARQKESDLEAARKDILAQEEAASDKEAQELKERLAGWERIFAEKSQEAARLLLKAVLGDMA